MKFNTLHHIAIICSDYERSKKFYTQILELEIVHETYRPETNSTKLDLALNGVYIIELFHFPDAPARVTKPEARGLRHLAFGVDDIVLVKHQLVEKRIEVKPLRIDPHTSRMFFFFSDPDGLPIEIYELSGILTDLS